MRVLVTGAAGFIGSHLADRLVAEGHDVFGVDDLSTGRATNVNPEVHLAVADVVEATLPEVELIYHCAASYRDRGAWERDARTNVLGTIAVVRAAQRSGARLVYFQTSLCYGPNPRQPVHVQDPLAPTGSYAVSKTAGERYIADSGVSYVSLRLANIYGPRNLSGTVPTFWQRLTEGRPCTVVDARRDYVFIDDLVDVAMDAAMSGNGPYHVSSGRDVSIAELYAGVVAAMGVDAPEATPIRRGSDDVATLLLDPKDTEWEWGWHATTPLAAGLRRAVDWYAANGVAETYTHLAMKG